MGEGEEGPSLTGHPAPLACVSAGMPLPWLVAAACQVEVRCPAASEGEGKVKITIGMMHGSAVALACSRCMSSGSEMPYERENNFYVTISMQLSGRSWRPRNGWWL